MLPQNAVFAHAGMHAFAPHNPALAAARREAVGFKPVP
jgi:hypothetical protein